MTNLLFVYGTLKKGKGNSGFLKDAFFLNTAKIKGVTMYNLGAFPAVVENGEYTVSGEVYKIDTKILKHVDALEGHPSFYTRKIKGLDTGQSAWVYFLPKKAIIPCCQIIKEGVWNAKWPVKQCP